MSSDETKDDKLHIPKLRNSDENEASGLESLKVMSSSNKGKETTKDSESKNDKMHIPDLTNNDLACL